MAVEVAEDTAASDRLNEQQTAWHRYLQRFVIQVQDKLLADRVTDLDLRKAARVLRPSDYDAVVEERQHSRRCGLPTCTSALISEPDANTAPKYRIRRAQRQVVHATPTTLRSYCSSACAALSATYRAGLSDVHLQFRGLVQSAAPAPGPVRARVVEKAPPAFDSYAEMLFELSRVARRHLEEEEDGSSSMNVI